MNEEAQKKLFFWGLIVLAVLGAIFILWAIFFNRGTLTVDGQAPFIINITGVKTESCSESPCSVEVAPGDYSVSLQKVGYQTVERQVSVPIGGEQVEEVTFQFIPVVTKLGVEAELQRFAEPVIEIPDLEDTPIFSEKSYATYLAFDPESKRQTLYIQGLADGELSEPRIATSFIRTIDDYTIIPSIEEHNRIALIDRTDEESTLYLVDLSEKSRTNLLSFPYIANVKWIKDNDNFLLEARANGDISSSIYLYDVEQGEVKKLDLRTSVENVEVLDSERLIAATSQSFIGAGSDDQLGGQLVTLGEIPATTEVTSGLFKSQLSFVEYYLPNNTARLMALETSVSRADAVQLGSDRKSILFLTNGEVYKLQFEE